jgi:uncharacterized delta-60 repeat protein
MWFRKSNKNAKPACRSLSYRPQLEALEDRCLPSAPGSLDTTFGSGGLVTTNFLRKSNDTALSIAVQPDGKIIAAGIAGNSSGYYFAVARYNPNGTLDTSFGPDHSGKVSTLFDTSYYGHSGWGFVLQPDGKIVVGGNPAYTTYELARYNANGTLDTTFGPNHNGTLTTTFVGAAGTTVTGTTLGGLAIETVGGSSKIVASIDWEGRDAFHTHSAFALARYNLDGTLDNSFGSGGEVVAPVFSYDTAIALNPVIIQADGKIVVGGEGEFQANNLQTILARYDTSGNLDASFGSGGLVTLPGSSADSLALQPDGKIVAGRIDGLLRFNVGVAGQPDGSLDTTFGVGGFAATTSSNESLAIQMNGKIVTVGRGSNSVARYNPDGSVDTGFGNAGFATMPASCSAYSVALQTDGKILAAGQSAANRQTGVDFAVARFLGDPIPAVGSFTANPVTAGSNGTLTVSNITDNNPSSSISQVAIYLDSNADGKLEPGTDTLLGYATQTSPGVWTYTFTVSLAPGSYTLFAQAQDNYSLFSDPCALALTVQ